MNETNVLIAIVVGVAGLLTSLAAIVRTFTKTEVQAETIPAIQAAIGSIKAAHADLREQVIRNEERMKAKHEDIDRIRLEIAEVKDMLTAMSLKLDRIRKDPRDS